MTRNPRSDAPHTHTMNFDKLPELRRNVSAVRARRSRWIVFSIMVVAAVGVFALHRTARNTEVREEQRANVATLREQLEVAQAAYMDAVRGNAPLEQRIEMAENLLTALRAIADVSPGHMSVHAAEIVRTETELGRFRLQSKAALSVERENEALAAAAAGDTEAAAALWREAWQLQRDVNRNGTGMRNLERELRLEQELVRLAAEPLHQQLNAKREAAQAAVAEKRWDAALAAYREARDLQERLNREFPRTRYSDLAAISRYDAEIASLSADNLDTRVSTKVTEARELASTGRHEEADKAFSEAADAQRTLNEQFGRSRFVSNVRTDEIEAERQTALAAAPLREATRLRDEAEQHLRRRQIFQAQQSLREALGYMEQVSAQMPRARGVDESMRLQLGFLNVRASDLAALQDRLYEQLVALPGGNVAMLRAEVQQADFMRVMSTNPSRNPGRQLPVDSVTHAEVEEFCRRATWVMGWRVRLPTEAEMRDAGTLRDFQQINGGLDEWLAGGDAGPNAPVLNADAAVRPALKSERSRSRGFRVVVEVDLSNPAG